jgi:hypothetical protein
MHGTVLLDQDSRMVYSGCDALSGLSLRWLRNLTGLTNTPNAYAMLSAEAAQILTGTNGLIF